VCSPSPRVGVSVHSVCVCVCVCVCDLLIFLHGDTTRGDGRHTDHRSFDVFFLVLFGLHRRTHSPPLYGYWYLRAAPHRYRCLQVHPQSSHILVLVLVLVFIRCPHLYYVSQLHSTHTQSPIGIPRCPPPVSRLPGASPILPHPSAGVSARMFTLPSTNTMDRRCNLLTHSPLLVCTRCPPPVLWLAGTSPTFPHPIAGGIAVIYTLPPPVPWLACAPYAHTVSY